MDDQFPTEGAVFNAMADRLADEGRRGITIDEAVVLGLGPRIDGEGAWGVDAGRLMELDTAVVTSGIALDAEQVAIEEAERERRGPSGRGLVRPQRPYGELTSDTPAYRTRRER